MKNTPRDVFLHLAAFAALYFTVIALITLLFSIIDYALPDEALRYVGNPYSGPMRFAIASLLILVPLFVGLMRMLQREARREPERQQLGVRRWLTYITLFIAGATFIGDLIALLDSFLGGTLATTFVLKALVLLAVMGAGFWYFMLDIRGHWLKAEGISRLAGYGLIGVVLLSIVGGFFIMGNPMAQRELQLDLQQTSDLSSIQYQVVSYWQQNERLPENLAVLENSVTGFYVPEAPGGRAAYEYEVRGELSFALCAEFAREWDADQYNAPYGREILRGAEWQHGAGRVCFERTIDPELIQPTPRAPVR